MSLTTLCTRSMIAFAYGWYVVTCSWFGFNAIIVTHLIKLTFEFAPIVKDNKLRSRVTCQPDSGVTHLFEITFEFAFILIVKDNKLRSRVTCQPGVMKQILDGCC
jgi:hypothetical protein